MNEKKDNWEKLIHLPEEYETNPDLVKNAIARFEREKQAKKKNWFFSHWKGLVIGAATCAVTAAIAIPVVLSLQQPEIVYYDPAEIVYDTDLDADSFISENDLDICYFSGTTVKTQCAKVIESEELAFLNQNFFDMDTFDKIDLKVVLLANAEFEFFEDFALLPQNSIVSELTVSFTVETVPNSASQTVKAKFTYEKVDYYLEILTQGQAEERLAYYVNMLIA